MFLKSVEIFGFKSFADKTRIEFQEGISALLGPNGCGKSNVVDAIKWVVGEQAAKSLRATKMENVIFDGTSNRKKLNVAEVTLTLSNEQKLLPMDVAEISVKRRLFRSGESEYFINEAPVKLKDVRELFMDTGIGKSAYSVMEQGRISQVLSNRPEERRYLFEEAAGITKYKARRVEAESKLEQTANNMAQVENVLSEVKKNYDNLKRQSEKTEKYRELNKRIFDYELNIQLLRLKTLKEDRFKKDNSFKEFQEKYEALQQEIDQLNCGINQRMGAVNDMVAKVTQARQDLYGIAVEQQSVEQTVKIYQEQISEIDLQISKKLDQEALLNEQQTKLETSIHDLEDTLYEYDGRVDGLKQDIENYINTIADNEQTVQNNLTEISDMNRLVRDSELQKEDLAVEIRRLSGDIVDQLDQSLKESGYSAAAKKGALDKILNQLHQLQIRLDGSLQILSDAGELQTVGEEMLKKLVFRSKEGFESALSDLKQFKEELDCYLTLVPSFIDDFIAPEGIITQKHQIEQQINRLVKKVESCRDRIDELMEENSALNSRIRESRSTLHLLREEQSKMEQQRAVLETQLNSYIHEKKQKQKEASSLLVEIENDRVRQNQCNQRIDDAHHNLRTLKERELHINDELKVLEKEIEKNNNDKQNKEKSLKKLIEDAGKSREAMDKLQLSLVEIDSNISNCYSNFRERHSRDLKEFESTMYEIRTSYEKLKDQLSVTRENIKNLGQVNLMAPEEFKEVKERYDFLNTQLEDLKNAKEDLVRITDRITTESIDLFLRTFKQINKNFHQMFRRLFGNGGHGELQLSNPEEVLNSGIEIMVQPPGKNLSNISLLSGGEKSMTAVALLLATYQVRPAPFCILDEIDAALDEANIGRFVNVLVEFAQKSQFIVITHNKKTVMGANTLLGVTMQESGVSTLISVRIPKQGEEFQADDEETKKFLDELESDSADEKEESLDQKEGEARGED